MKKILKIIIALVVTHVSVGQDYHFSQFFQHQLSLNPALTGRFKEDYRISMIHRNQWRGINASFVSTAAGGEINFKEGIFNRDKLGVGIYGYNDQLGEGIITNNAVFASVAYHHTLDHHKRHKLSGGAQLGYISKRINTDGFQFGNQYQFWTFNSSLPNFEALENQNISYLDVQAGVYYSYMINELFHVEAGISAFDLTTPTESLQTIDSLATNTLGSRWVATIGADYKFDHFILYPKVLFVNQSGAGEVTPGILARYDFGSTSIVGVYGGLFYRNKDAAIFMTGVHYKNIEIMGSYDMTTSGLADFEDAEGISRSGISGAYEISINILGIFNKSVPAQYTVPCGIF